MTTPKQDLTDAEFNDRRARVAKVHRRCLRRLIDDYRVAFKEWDEARKPTPQKPEPSGDRSSWGPGLDPYHAEYGIPSPTPGDKDASISKMEIVEPSGSVEGLVKRLWARADEFEKTLRDAPSCKLFIEAAEALSRMEQERIDFEILAHGYTDEIAQLQAENQRISLEVGRYREALEFYADKEHYDNDTQVARGDGSYDISCSIFDDEGSIARNALAGGAEK